MSDERETRSAPLGLRILPSIKKALAQAAAEDHRTVASYVEKLLTEHLKAAGYLGGTATSTLSNEPHLAKR
ncbi:hypothetical protein U8607_16155 [Methylobacterium durans]|uniref:Toxin-antitoxin system HicB family antitoxin n=1 Tax=Methylobacterium durans TaxID=2202825 RepID=A0A2U8W3W9_9HYPH|nr:hypothetical protein [Methylobacterium durans]AWN39976.1 hypothetical protein DK389_04730 [Methylobacterium durans]MEA1833617.1 hypothetical protein [Methylobacterium durans]